jgi:hypothetical protein
MQNMPNYKYTLPDDRAEVQLMAYASGFISVVEEFFRERPPGDPLPKFPVIKLPTSMDDEESMAEYMYDRFLDEFTKKGQLMTNSFALLKSLFVPACKDGYNFALFACAQGLIALEYPLSSTQRIELAARFATEQFMDISELEPLIDAEVAAALNELYVIFKDYLPFRGLEV